MKKENEERDDARELIEAEIGKANDAGAFCDACVARIAMGHRPVKFCATCYSVLVLWIASIVEREWAQMAAEEPGRFTITKQGEETLMKRNW